MFAPPTMDDVARIVAEGHRDLFNEHQRETCDEGETFDLVNAAQAALCLTGYDDEELADSVKDFFGTITADELPRVREALKRMAAEWPERMA